MRKGLRLTGIAVAAVFLGAQLYRPVRSNPQVESAQSALAILQAPPDVAAVLRRSCIDCHTNDTRWPWYTNVAPVSWWTVDHVNHGRAHLNFSEWGKLPREDAASMLAKICEQIESSEMPLPSYLWMHGNAQLSGEERKAICLWTVEQRNRLAGKTPEHEGHR